MRPKMEHFVKESQTVWWVGEGAGGGRSCLLQGEEGQVAKTPSGTCRWPEPSSPESLAAVFGEGFWEALQGNEVVG